MGTENTIGGLTRKDIESVQDRCRIYARWGRRHKDFCQAECARVAVVTICPQVLEGSEVDKIPVSTIPTGTLPLHSFDVLSAPVVTKPIKHRESDVIIFERARVLAGVEEI